MTNILSTSLKWYPILFDTTQHIVQSVFTWISLLFFFCYVISYLSLRDKPIWKSLKKYEILTAIIYATVVFITLLILAYKEDGIVTILFVPIFTAILLVAGSVVLLLLKPSKSSQIIAGALIIIGILPILICIGIHFASGAASEINGVDDGDVSSVMLYLFAGIGIALIFFLSFFFGKKGKGGFDTRSIAYAAICVALAFALSFLSLVKLPQGGSVTLVSLLPLMLYSQMFGLRKGVIVGFIYGLLQAIQTPYILHPGQFLLDYPIAFAMIGLSSFFTQGEINGKKGVAVFALGAIFAATMRYLAHFVSGVFAFATYARYAGYDSAVVYSLAYNSFVFVDMAIALIVGVLILLNRGFRKIVNGVTASAFPSPKQGKSVVESSETSE